MGLGHTLVEQFCYDLPHQPTLSGPSLSGHHLDDAVVREGHDAVEIEFPFYPIFEMVSLPIVQPRYSFQPFVHSSNVFAKIAIKNQIHLKKHGKSCKNSNVFEKRTLVPLIITIIFFLHYGADCFLFRIFADGNPCPRVGRTTLWNLAFAIYSKRSGNLAVERTIEE